MQQSAKPSAEAFPIRLVFDLRLGPLQAGNGGFAVWHRVAEAIEQGQPS